MRVGGIGCIWNDVPTTKRQKKWRRDAGRWEGSRRRLPSMGQGLRCENKKSSETVFGIAKRKTEREREEKGQAKVWESMRPEWESRAETEYLIICPFFSCPFLACSPPSPLAPSMLSTSKIPQLPPTMSPTVVDDSPSLVLPSPVIQIPPNTQSGSPPVLIHSYFFFPIIIPHKLMLSPRSPPVSTTYPRFSSSTASTTKEIYLPVL